MLANVVWPSLYLADRLVAPTVIVISLAIEFAALKHVLKFSVKRTCALVVAINLTSAIVGCYLISTAGYHWELGPGADIADYLNTGTFNSISWVLAIVLAIVTNTALESVVAVALFKVRSGRAIRWLAYGNSATALLAYLSIRVVPPHL